jgi:hypothetical protein
MIALLQCDNLNLADHVDFLFKSLRCRGLIADIENVDHSILHIRSDQIWDLKKENSPEWKSSLPDQVVKYILDSKNRF